MSEWEVREGDCLDVLRTLPAESAQLVVTSPPYWALRDYGDPGQLGLEDTPDEYVAKLVAVFREVRRVLRDDGVVWLNLGDTYTSGGRDYRDPGRSELNGGGRVEGLTEKGTRPDTPAGLKPKELVMIPFRVASALQADGWWLRSDTIWSKPNPMPESVRDRPTKSHEYLFMLTKSPRYYFDAHAIREPSSPDMRRRAAAGHTRGGTDVSRDMSRRDRERLAEIRTVTANGRNKRTVWEVPDDLEGLFAQFLEWYAAQPAEPVDVWTVTTQPFPGAHFAVFPPKLIEPCVLSSSAARACGECGAPWQRLVERTVRLEGNSARAGRDPAEIRASGKWGADQVGENLKAGPVVDEHTTGWEPTCTCHVPGDLRPDDLEVISTPTGERSGEDPSLFVGRAGYARPRGEGEGTRPMTRYEQRAYARQLQALKRRPIRRQAVEQAGGRTTFDHYKRTDRAGARPIPPALLERWIAAGILERVSVPDAPSPDDSGRSLVLDPFAGAGTTGLVATQLGRDFLGIELSPKYAEMARERIARALANPAGHLTGDPEPHEGQLGLLEVGA